MCCTNINARYFTTKTLLDACGYVVLSKNSPEMTFTEPEIVKLTSCEFYVAGVVDSLTTSLRVNYQLKNNKTNYCYNKWLKSSGNTYVNIISKVYQYISDNPDTLKLPPDVAVTEAYNHIYPLKNCS